MSLRFDLQICLQWCILRDSCFSLPLAASNVSHVEFRAKLHVHVHVHTHVMHRPHLHAKSTKFYNVVEEAWLAYSYRDRPLSWTSQRLLRTAETAEQRDSERNQGTKNEVEL